MGNHHRHQSSWFQHVAQKEQFTNNLWISPCLNAAYNRAATNITTRIGTTMLTANVAAKNLKIYELEYYNNDNLFIQVTTRLTILR
jgi:hypothetical protein